MARRYTSPGSHPYACLAATLELVVESLAPLAFSLLLVLIFYVVVLRPARNRQREVANLQAGLSVGEVVMLASGVFGELVHVEEERVRLRIAASTVITVHRQAVSRVISAEELAELRAEGSVVWDTV